MHSQWFLICPTFIILLQFRSEKETSLAWSTPLTTHRKEGEDDALHFVCLMVDLVDTPSLVGSLAYTGFHVV